MPGRQTTLLTRSDLHLCSQGPLFLLCSVHLQLPLRLACHSGVANWKVSFRELDPDVASTSVHLCSVNSLAQEWFCRSRLTLFLPILLRFHVSVSVGEVRILGTVVVNPWYCSGWIVRHKWYGGIVGEAIQEPQTAGSPGKSRFGWCAVRQSCRRTADGGQQ